jgi:solute carrier family 25 (mitochondrial carnitine/acylcarnitine transporter), member 20/29
MSQGFVFSASQFAGGMAGLFSFLFLHPIDVLKSLAQSIVPGSGKTLKDAMRESYKAEGSRYLLRGIVPTCLRAFPVSAVVFAVQENVVKVLSRR